MARQLMWRPWHHGRMTRAGVRTPYPGLRVVAADGYGMGFGIPGQDPANPGANPGILDAGSAGIRYEAGGRHRGRDSGRGKSRLRLLPKASTSSYLAVGYGRGLGWRTRESRDETACTRLPVRISQKGIRHGRHVG